ncbi:hypothetical protein ACELLULO517_10685 [Acidisoma cellulosilytica]|uniref:GAF domain-containing protein n=1 Tax=Acidisoma cellulosilyticum TaxID=2802395 RepID=A0A964E481_9PROT|nr:hypothetical protein [Acidisoma cellulosilyticum]MCB8880698.1 hypothetical protein [Acidisoma cellulosilyticum]
MHRARLQRFFGRALLIIITIWGLGIILPDLYRVVAPLHSLGTTIDNSGRVVDVVTPFQSAALSPAAQAGIRPGDRLDLTQMRCKGLQSPSCASIIAVLGGFGGFGYVRADDKVTLILRPGQGLPARTLHLIARPAPLAFLSRIALVADTIVGVGFILIAFYLAWTRPSRMTWGFFLYAIWFNGGQNYAIFAVLQALPFGNLAEILLESLAQGAAYAGLLAFALRFPHEMVDPRWRRLDAGLPLLGAVVALFALLCSANLFGIPTGLASDAFFFSIIPLDAAALLILVLRQRELAPQDEARMRWAIAGCAIGLPAFLLAEIFTSTGLPYALFGAIPSQLAVQLLYLLHGGIAYFVGTAVRRRRVVSVTIPLSRGVTLTILAFLLGVPILYLHDELATINEHLGGELDLPGWFWPFVVGPLALLLLARLHERAVVLTERAFNRSYHRAQHMLQHASHTVVGAKTFTEVDRLLTEVPVAGLRLASAAVFRSLDGTFRRVGPSIGWPEDGLTTLDETADALALRCLAEDAPLPLPRGRWHRPGLPPDDLAPCLAVPVHGGATESAAIILCGPHVTGSDISRDERKLLKHFAKQAALGYDHVETEALRREVVTLRAALSAFRMQNPGDATSA